MTRASTPFLLVLLVGCAVWSPAPAPTPSDTGYRTADSLPLAAIRSIEEHGYHEWRTIGLATAIAVPLGILIGLVASGYAD